MIFLWVFCLYVLSCKSWPILNGSRLLGHIVEVQSTALSIIVRNWISSLAGHRYPEYWSNMFFGSMGIDLKWSAKIDCVPFVLAQFFKSIWTPQCIVIFTLKYWILAFSSYEKKFYSLYPTDKEKNLKLYNIFCEFTPFEWISTKIFWNRYSEFIS